MMLGLTEVTAGTVSVLGHDPVREPLQVKRQVGYLPDTVGFYDHMTAARQSALHRGPDRHRARPSATSGSRRRSIASASPTSATSGSATFSRGMRQRLGLAEILMKDVSIAILDEPTSGLDPQATAELLEMIRSLKHDGVAVLLSSHLLERVQSVCDRVALFNAGHIALIGTVPELARQVLGGGYNVEVEADGEGLAEKFSEMPGVKAVDQAGPSRYRLLAERDVRPQAAAAVVNAGGQLRRLSVEEPSLDAIYNRYFQNHPMQGDMQTCGVKALPGAGLSVVFFRELFDHLTSARMLVLEFLVVLLGGAVVYFAAEQIRNTTAEDPFLFLRLFAPPGQIAAVVRAGAQHPGADHGDRARLRLRQRRIQPPHHVAHPGAADLPRRAAVRKIPGRASRPSSICLVTLWLLVIGFGLHPARHPAERGGDSAGC